MRSILSACCTILLLFSLLSVQVLWLSRGLLFTCLFLGGGWASLVDTCVAQTVEMDQPSRPCWLHGPSRSGVSYMLQIILWTNRDILDCPTTLYTLSLYGNMLIIAIIVLSLHRCMPLFSSFMSDCCMIGLFYCSTDGPKPYSFYCV